MAGHGGRAGEWLGCVVTMQALVGWWCGEMMFPGVGDGSAGRFNS